MILLYLLIGIGWTVAQTVKVSGTVISDEDGQPIIGAAVTVRGAANAGTVTDMDGRYTLNVPASAKTLIISYVGMRSEEIPISDKHVTTVLRANLALDEVVVTALGISREKKALGYAVTEVGGDEMLKSRGGVSNPINALQGKVAGLQIAGGAGSMGGSSKILIRGTSSISGNNQPLFVIDGVPIEGQGFNDAGSAGRDQYSTARGGGGYDYGNLIQDINPDDIASISVLKGPNASALYGSRATNGVVMITTKKGAKNEGYGITFNTAVGFEVVNKLPKLQKLYGGGGEDKFTEVMINGQKYLYPDYATDESWGPKLDNQQVLSWADLARWEIGGQVGNPKTSAWKTPDNDVETFFKTGVSFTNNVAISQATDRSSIRVSYTNSELSGYMPNSSLRKNVFNVSASTTSADKKLEVMTNVTYFNSAARGRSQTGYDNNNVMEKFIQWGHRQLDMKELEALYKSPIDGSQITWNRSDWNDPRPAYANNPYWSRYENYQNDTRNRVYGNVGFVYHILPSLKFQYKANLDFFADKQFERNAVYSQEQSQYKETARQQYELNNEFMLLYNQTVGDLTVNANLGANLMKRHYEMTYGRTVGGLAIADFYNMSNSVSPATAENYQLKKAINSVFASATLGWRSMLYLDASLRNDWSSTLPVGNNSYMYPSVTGSFVFSELLKNKLTWLNFGKLRLGYAQVGNDTDPYQVINTMTQYTHVDPSTPGYVVSNTLKNENLKPESTNSFEAGLELSLFDNRVSLEATVYASQTKDQIVPLSVSGTTGYTFRVVNGGVIENKGMELMVKVLPIRSRTFTWETALTLASNKNKVKEMVVDYYRIATAPFKVEIGAMKGEAYGVIMGTDYKYDKNGNKLIDAEGRYMYTDGNVNLGSIFPDFTGGWSNTFRLGNIDLSVLLDFSKGGHYFSTSYLWGMYSGMLEESAANGIRENGIVLEGVHEDGTPNTTKISAKQYGNDHNSGPAAQNVLRSDYVKLREINIGYTIPLKKKDAFFKAVRVSAYGRNLAVWGPDTKHFDPEMIVTGSGNIQGIEGGALPSVANFGFNVNLKF